MITLDAFPESLVPHGKTTYRAKAGPSSMLSVPQGELVIIRDAAAIVLESEKHGRVTLAKDVEDPTRVHVTLSNGEAHAGRFELEGLVVAFVSDSGHRLTFSPVDDRVEVRFEGFGALDRIKLYLRRA